MRNKFILTGAILLLVVTGSFAKNDNRFLKEIVGTYICHGTSEESEIKMEIDQKNTYKKDGLINESIVLTIGFQDEQAGTITEEYYFDCNGSYSIQDSILNIVIDPSTFVMKRKENSHNDTPISAFTNLMYVMIQNYILPQLQKECSESTNFFIQEINDKQMILKKDGENVIWTKK